MKSSEFYDLVELLENYLARPENYSAEIDQLRIDLAAMYNNLSDKIDHAWLCRLKEAGVEPIQKKCRQKRTSFCF